ncbi:MAG TPA: tyrosine-type recombinase/integrase [Acidimicrobiales bacterium]|nr:tyrosine-type recombinase/integrase [Acidimicrobiales bacterium]
MKEDTMKGHVKKRGDRYYAVIYEGRDPVTGKERRSWHPAGTVRAEAERLAAKLAATETSRVDSVRSLTFGAYLTSQWLPAKKLHLAISTYHGYERNVQIHILPVLGRVGIRRLRYQQIEALYDTLLHPTEGKGLSPKTVYEVHLIIKGALADALRRGLVSRNVAVVARAPKQRSLQRIEGASLTEDELRQLMRSAVGHRLFPLYWLTAMTGMRRNEVLGLKWPDIDFTKRCLHLNRGLVAVGYEIHQTRGKTKNARRAIALDDTTLTILAGWRDFQAAEFAAVGITNDDRWVFTDGAGKPVHPHSVYEAFRRIVHNAGVSTIRFHDLRHTHGSLLIQDGIPVKVVSERLGQANIGFTMQTYQHVLPGMQADAARSAERLAKPTPPTARRTGERRGNGRRKSA